jgi:hypothetical protein
MGEAVADLMIQELGPVPKDFEALNPVEVE